MLFMWGICPVCRKPLVKVEPGTMEFKPCREHPHATPEIKPLCRACMRKIVTPSASYTARADRLPCLLRGARRLDAEACRTVLHRHRNERTVTCRWCESCTC